MDRYHAKLQYGGLSHYWWNYEKESLVKGLLIPFINGQVVLIRKGGLDRILNMKSVSLITIFKTKESLEKGDKSIPSQIDHLESEKNDCTQEILNEVQREQAVVSSQSFLQTAFSKPENQVFVIMKFNDSLLDSAYEGVIKPVIEKYGYRALRIDEIQDSGKITDQILSSIASSKFILSELSGERPNCYYETGFAQALGKELILVIKKGEITHFDLAGHRIIEWGTEADLRKKLDLRFKGLSSDDTDDN